MSDTRTAVTDPERLLSELGWTRRLARGLVGGDDSEAEDVAQETWVATLRARPTAGRPLRPWLRQVAMNLVRGRLRGARRRRIREQNSAAVQPAVATPEDLVQRAELHRRLVELVLALDEPLRLTVLQRYFEGRSAAAIAAATGTPAGTVRWRLKTALEQLRAGLAGHGQEDEGARRLLLPMLWDLRRRPTPSRGGLVTAAVVGTVLAGAALLLVLSRPELSLPRVATDEAYPTRASAGAPPPPHPAPAQRTQAALTTCLQDIARAQPELAKLRQQRQARVRPGKLFREGSPNPRAWLELDGLIRRIIAGDEPVFPSYVFECRTWACKLVLYQDDLRDQPGAPGRPALPSMAALAAARANPMDVFRRYEPGWNLRIQSDPDFLARVRGREMRAGEPSFDPLMRKAVMRNEIYFTLADPTGHPLVAGDPGFVPQAWGEGALPPATAEDCTRSARAMDAEMERMRTEVDSLAPPGQKYEAAPPNPALARAFAAHVREVAAAKNLGDVVARFAVDCRGQICRLSGAEGPFDLERMARPLIWHGAFQTRLERLSSTNDSALFAVSAEPRADGRVILNERSAAFRSGAHIRACAARHPAVGSLRVKLSIPSSGRENEDGVEGKISYRIGGNLAGTSYAACVAEGIEREIVEPPLPAHVRGVWHDEVWPVP